MTDNKILNNDRFVRWQQVLREHVTFLNNLLLTISIGITGFLLSLLNAPSFTLTCCQKIFFTFGLIVLFISIISGLTASLSRLLDFRTTVKKIKNEIKNSSASEIDDMKELMELYKKTTWFLFYTQIITFFIVTISLSIAFFMIYSNKLF